MVGGAMVRFMSAGAGIFPPAALSLAAGRLHVRSGPLRVTPLASSRKLGSPHTTVLEKFGPEARGVVAPWRAPSNRLPISPEVSAEHRPRRPLTSLGNSTQMQEPNLLFDAAHTA